MKKFSISIIIIAIVLTLTVGYSEKVLGDLSQSMVRLHVLANSDTEEDQALKLRVRDKILEAGKSIFTPSDSCDETLKKLRDNYDLLLSAAREEIKTSGFDYDVKIEVGKFFFPAKAYENIALPAGNYEAVRVIIGEGEGKNWWCVMFPPLCFVSSSVGTADNKANDMLRSKLSDDEYSLITDDSNLPVNIRFKIVDFIQTSANSIKTALKK